MLYYPNNRIGENNNLYWFRIWTPICLLSTSNCQTYAIWCHNDFMLNFLYAEVLHHFLSGLRIVSDRLRLVKKCGNLILLLNGGDLVCSKLWFNQCNVVWTYWDWYCIAFNGVESQKYGFCSLFDFVSLLGYWLACCWS